MDLEILVKGFGVDEHIRLKTQRSLLEKFCESEETNWDRALRLVSNGRLAQVAIDFGGRNWLVWETEFKREMVEDADRDVHAFL
jgi:imidazoleglycerol-phosphate dehydratase/histidinol-phosphatase